MKAQLVIVPGPQGIDAGLCGGVLVLAAAGTLMLAPPAHAAEAYAAAAAKAAPVTLERPPGSAVPRVILAAKAADRLGIETSLVGEQTVARRQMVSGLVVPPSDKPMETKPAGGTFGGFGKPAAPPPAAPALQVGTAYGNGLAKVAVPPAPAGQGAPAAATPVAGEVWVLVSLSPGEYERLAKDKPARLVPLATRANPGKELSAQPTAQPPVEDVKRTMMSIYYKVPGKDHGLALNTRMRVDLPLSGPEEKQKAVPYSAVYYDAKGEAWVYVNPKPLTYERQRVEVERVVGDTALLSSGPPVGTPVVTVGAALLYGTEVFKK